MKIRSWLILVGALSALSCAWSAPAYRVDTLAGGGPTGYGSADGTGAAAQFEYPRYAALDATGNLYVADSTAGTIRKITPAGVVTTVAGLAGSIGSTDATGSAARFSAPWGVAVDSAGNVFVADTNNHTIRKITPGGVVTTIAGLAGNPGSKDGTGSAARFNQPYGIAVDNSGDVFVVDSNNNTIREINSGGAVTTLAGQAGTQGSTDATGSAARFRNPKGLAIDQVGNLYVADHDNYTIRKVTPAGVVSTVAGLAGSPGTADGTGSAARFDGVYGLAVDFRGNVYAGEYDQGTIRKITSGGVVTTIAGRPGLQSYQDGTGRAAFFGSPVGFAVDSVGIVYIVDASQLTVRKARPLRGTDLNKDGWADILWQNTSTGDRYLWELNGPNLTAGVPIGTVPIEWKIAASGDFNLDGSLDLVWQNTNTGDRVFWFMNGTTFTSGAFFTNLSTDWQIAGAADFDGDGSPDLIWQNTATGERYIWLMNQTFFSAAVPLGTISTDWQIAGAADFNGDGKPDLLWQNTTTGERYIWLMNGTSFVSAVSLGTVPTVWQIAGAADVDGDDSPEIIWQNTSTGDRYLWKMIGPAYASTVYLTTVPPVWQIVDQAGP
jgi:hypothetical protein